jgi:histidinol dehydrogenase
MPFRLDAAAADFHQKFEQLLHMKRETAEEVDHVVRDIIADVIARGDEALIDYSRRFDRIELTPETLRVSRAEVDAATAACTNEQIAALELARDRIVAFHDKQRPSDLRFTDEAGVELGWRWTAVDSAGLYVPGGTAAYPSSVLMNAVPAKVAGVERLAMVVPAPDGQLPPLVLAAARIAGVDEIFRVGGAQAVAALAYGTQTIRPVAKIVGPGGQCGIDMIAGPSEVLILADRTARADWIAIDLLAQAEHDTAAQSILITDDRALADAVEAAVAERLKTLPRRAIAEKSWNELGATVIVEKLEQALPLADRIAAEHLEIMAVNAEELAAGVRNAGAIFIGAYTPEAIGDYVGGSNHVLPTARSARFSSGLNVLDFMKRTSLLKCSPQSLRAIGPAAVVLGAAERLDAHALSVALRLESGAGQG